MKGILKLVVGVAVLALVFTQSVAAQQKPPQQPPQQPPPQQQQPPAGQKPPAGQFGIPGQAAEPAPPSPEEEAAYKNIVDTQAKKRNDFGALIQLGEEFVKKYPESRYNSAIYASLAQAYLAAGREADMFLTGEKSLELYPDNIDALALMAWAIPRRVQGSDLDLAQKLEKSEAYAKHGIEILEALTKPDSMDEAEFTKSKNGKLSMCHSGLGVVYFRTERFPDSATELEKATQLAPEADAADLLVLGLAYENLKRFHDAVAAYEKCAANPSPLQQQCKVQLQNAKKQAATQLAPPKP
jgi:tetratricopeptide (TPR) repeat protein